MVNKSFKSFMNYDFDIFIQEIKNEWNNQDLKFPNQTHTLEKWIVIIMEEIGEIAKSVIEIKDTYNFNNLHKEIIQSITLLLRLRYSIYVFKDSNIII